MNVNEMNINVVNVNVNINEMNLKNEMNVIEWMNVHKMKWVNEWMYKCINACSTMNERNGRNELIKWTKWTEQMNKPGNLGPTCYPLMMPSVIHNARHFSIIILDTWAKY
jgi:hypothetical protein